MTEKIIGCAIEVHQQLGPGWLESAYEAAMCVELEMHGLCFARRVSAPVVYSGRQTGEYRLDLLVENPVVVERKSVERFDPVLQAQILTYMGVTGKLPASSSTSISNC